MYIRKGLKKNGLPAAIIVRAATEERLRAKCFRGRTVCKAGNFSRWSTPVQLFSDTLILEQFLDEISVLWDKKDFGTHSVEIRCDNIVGWSSTAPTIDFAPDSLEQFNPNRKSVALRVKLFRTDLLARQTKLVTIVYEFKVEAGNPVAVVHSAYPGEDVGELEGDVTAREERIFFDWNHPGDTGKI